MIQYEKSDSIRGKKKLGDLLSKRSDVLYVRKSRFYNRVKHDSVRDKVIHQGTK